MKETKRQVSQPIRDETVTDTVEDTVKETETKQDPLEKVVQGIVVGIDKDNRIIINQVGNPDLVVMAGLVNVLTSRISHLIDLNSRTGVWVTNEVGKSVAMLHEKMDNINKIFIAEED